MSEGLRVQDEIFGGNVNTALQTKDAMSEAIEQTVIQGDLSKLSASDRLKYYNAVCQSVGLNPLTQPFAYITLNGRLTLYAKKDCTDQLRTIHGISIAIVDREVVEDCYVVTAQARRVDGRTDESIGAVSVGGLKGDAKCNALMKAETKAKRRVTLSICGLGMLDETELETIPAVAKKPVEVTTEDIHLGGPGNGTSVAKPASASTGAGDVQRKGSSPAPTSIPPSVPSSSDPVEYIRIGEQANFHKQFNQALGKMMNADKDIICYGWLKDNGFVNEKGEPTAGRIPAAGWLEVRDKAVEYAIAYAAGQIKKESSKP